MTGLDMMRQKWFAAATAYRIEITDETRNALRHAERDYTFLWRRTRHRLIYKCRAFPDRPVPLPT
jgi:hypothetical protein